jgi:hypothetical protein
MTKYAHWGSRNALTARFSMERTFRTSTSAFALDMADSTFRRLRTIPDPPTVELFLCSRKMEECAHSRNDLNNDKNFDY